jgi:DNA-binding NtrC family response regulator
LSKQTKILIVDDDPNILEVLEARLTAAGFFVYKENNPESAIKRIKKSEVKLLISDMKMPQMSGTELLTEIKKVEPDLPVIFLTAYGTIPDAVNALKSGAVDYIQKPFDGKELIDKIYAILKSSIHFTNKPYPFASTEDGFYWGKTKAMKELHAITKKVAVSNANVLILGESGVGKECIAKAIHNKSNKNDASYIVVDCGSTPAGILESELFGHMKGSFTHAVQDKEGLIEAADGGTLFLDEIGNISREMQSRLLRFLEDRKIRPVGSVKEKEVNCRVLSATNADLLDEIEKGNFRQDLFYRLKVVSITIPPLRKRKEDIPELSRLFADKYIHEHMLKEVAFSDNTLKLLKSYSWPGNIRELKHAVEAGIVLCKNGIIEPSDLQLEEARLSQKTDIDTGFSIGDSEKKTIIRALKKTNGIQKDAAELLDISRRSIHYKIQKYEIDISEIKKR